MVAKFLLVDDDPDDRDLFCEALLEIDPKIVCYAASGGRNALANLKTGAISLPDIIFLDINMPGMNGWQILSFLKEDEESKDIPVIMYSTSSHPEDVEKAHSFGALCMFTKPPSFAELKKCLELVLGHLVNGSLPALMSSSPLFTTMDCGPMNEF